MEGQQQLVVMEYGRTTTAQEMEKGVCEEHPEYVVVSFVTPVKSRV
jgi:hypothetical protein